MNALQKKTFAQRFHIDLPLFFSLLFLCGLGVLVLYSASGEQSAVVFRQVTKIGIAFFLMCLVAQISPYTIERWSVGIFFISIIFLVIVLWLGDTGKGSQRWLDLGFFSFQPSEIMKFTVPMIVAKFIAHRTLPPSLDSVFMVALLVAIPVFLIAKQPDLGTAFLVCITGLSIVFVAGISFRLITLVSILCAMCTPILWHFMHDYQKQRVLTFFDYEQDPLGVSYHIIQSMIAVGSGGIQGKGWLNGTQSHLEFLPERTTDFIFAVYCEEFGLIGVFVLLCVYLCIIGRSIYIIMSAQRIYEKLLASALVVVFFLYIFVNMGMVVGGLPIVGIPLPLMSYGGSSIVTFMLTFGILMSIHTHRRITTH